jgi:fibronectin type 3 domain-containing protein
LILFAIGIPASAQIDTLSRDPIQVLARPGKDSIVLRWAPMKSSSWQLGNKQGYTIERYTLVRDGKVLNPPEKKILTPSALKPYPESQWERIAGNNKYTIIAAQALLGETFELNMKQNNNTASIVNKAAENEQRFSIALFCADLSPVTAKALGLYYSDTQVTKGEKYLYRITSGVSGAGSMTGSSFVSPDDPYKLTPPLKFFVETKGKLVDLRWDQSHHKRIYTTYRIERSEDGKNFESISDDPVVSLSPYSAQETELQYAVDSLPQAGKEYHYRVLGITPFGEAGPPSEVKSVIGQNILNELPNITSAVTVDNKTISLSWTFPSASNDLIEGFVLERAITPTGTFNKVHEGILGKASRSYVDAGPKQTNYYRVAAQTADKRLLKSTLYYAQLVDSIPPSIPTDLTGSIDDAGNVRLSWKPNTDPDIYGYRVYRAYYRNDEFAQVTTGPLRESKFNDRVDVESLNDKIHYRLMAIDNNQNHSALSAIFTITLPDKLPPVSPVLLPVISKDEGVALSWMPSSSTDVLKYDLYRKTEDRWIRLTSINANADSIYTYTDTNLNNGETQYYTVIAVDEANLESPPAPAVVGQKLKRNIWPEVKLQEPVVNRESKVITLRWTYEYTNVQLYQVYKGTTNESLQLYRSVKANEFVDRIVPGAYQYRVVAIFNDGSKSAMGKGVTVTF